MEGSRITPASRRAGRSRWRSWPWPARRWRRRWRCGWAVGPRHCGPGANPRPCSMLLVAAVVVLPWPDADTPARTLGQRNLGLLLYVAVLNLPTAESYSRFRRASCRPGPLSVPAGCGHQIPVRPAIAQRPATRLCLRAPCRAESGSVMDGTVANRKVITSGVG